MKFDKHPSCNCCGCRHSRSKTKGEVKKISNRQIRQLAKKHAHDEIDGPIMVPGGYRC